MKEQEQEKKGKYSDVNQKIVKYPVLNEAEFYEVYLTLNNLSKPTEIQLSDKAIKLLAAYMAKPLDFVFEFNSKKNSKIEKTRASQLGDEIGITSSYTYYLMKELRDKRALTIDEDKIIRTNADLTKLREGTKNNLKHYDVMQFEYVFKAKVVDTDEYNESNIPTNSI